MLRRISHPHHTRQTQLCTRLFTQLISVPFTAAPKFSTQKLNKYDKGAEIFFKISSYLLRELRDNEIAIFLQ